jgi:hypothetical protein
MTDTASESRPGARGYSWPPAEPGNTLALRHGANSPRLVSERAAEILEEYREKYPWLNAELDGVLFDDFIKSKARLDMLHEYVAGIISGEVEAYPRKGFPRTGVEAVPDRLWQQLARESRIVADLGAKLGFAPTNRAAMYRDCGMAWHLGSPGVESLAGSSKKFHRLRALPQ